MELCQWNTPGDVYSSELTDGRTETDRQTETWWRKTWTEFSNTTEASSQKSLGSFVLAGDKVPRWPEGELLTDEKGDFELQKSLSYLIYASQLV